MLQAELKVAQFENDALNDEGFSYDNKFEIQKKLEGFKSFYNDINNAVFNINTISNADMIPFNSESKKHSALNTAVYEQVWGTAAAIDRNTRDSEEAISNYHFNFHIDNKYLKGNVSCIVNAKNKHLLEKYIKLINSQRVSTDQPSITDDTIEKIKKLKSLLDCGAITEEEFNEKKKQLLQNL
jgi:hypothetical protein